ncbi:hypothetical protein CQ12_38420 [Bradyrhizobium jicamae]|uniref:Uncharacterized protein n=1 Tax=Bradyrhizobium jicamae TaxID=280332 RepID=A0A0R3KLE6_9BRAD|nr:hypothetical protein CQ12_38420 [Bradyrhizobium jicamae]
MEEAARNHIRRNARIWRIDTNGSTRNRNRLFATMLPQEEEIKPSFPTEFSLGSVRKFSGNFECAFSVIGMRIMPSGIALVALTCVVLYFAIRLTLRRYFPPDT